MHYSIKNTKSCCTFLLAAVLVTGCAGGGGTSSSPSPSTTLKAPALTETAAVTMPFDYQVDPESFSLTLDINGNKLSVANAMPTKTVSDLKTDNGTTSWMYPEEQISVTIKPTQDYLSVSITSDSAQDAAFTWPLISAAEYYLPLGEGKRVPANDEAWKEYLVGSGFSVLEQFSMPFWASSMGEYAVMYLMEDPHRSQVNFTENGALSFDVSYDYPQISENRTKRFRIYVTENEPAAVAKAYRSYVMEKGAFVTLEEKAQTVPDIQKLYGAPFIYLWGSFLVSPDDIQWNAFRKVLDSPVINHLLTFADTQENGAEFKDTLQQIRNQDYIGSYQKNIICRYISGVLTEDNFWKPNVFPNQTAEIERLLETGLERLSISEKTQLYKYAMAANLPGVFNDPSTWMNTSTVDLISDLKNSGIEQAWIGLHGYEQAFAKPEIVDAAKEQDYLIASYDSYHSIHEPGKEQWETAKFPDTTLYEQATVTGKDGKKLNGFQNVGRKLNPVLALPSVKDRMKTIVEENKLDFNSWFVDCDATGEIYDDYTPEHITTQEEDLAARMQRMAYIRDTYQMVVGSEGGNDFAASTIAFAHGIELKSFSWMDEDMKKNKESEYYIGKYFNPAGGVAEHFAKRVPLKEKYYTLFVNPSYDLPLFKLVYNDSVISSYHWEWPTFKIKGATQTRMLREILYNTPPLYHLDAEEWAEYKDDIAKHTTVWSTFSKQATMQEMTDFSYLSPDGFVQSTQYGTDIWVIANFSDAPYQYQKQEIPANSALIYMDGTATVYTPNVSEGHE